MTRNRPLHLAAIAGLLTAAYSAGHLGTEPPAPQDPLELARESHFEIHPLRREDAPRLLRLGLSLCCERNVAPSREPILMVPHALAVAQQNERMVSLAASV